MTVPLMLLSYSAKLYLGISILPEKNPLGANLLDGISIT